MPTECSALLRGKVARITKVDGCGNPVRCDPNDPSSPPVHVVSDGVISIQVEPEIDDGTDITQDNWAGESCIDEPACPKIRWVNITADFCRMDPDLFSMWTGVPVLKDPRGVATGFRIRKNVSCEEGVALEMWTGSKAADRCAAGGQAKYGYVVIPWVVNGILGSYTIENGSVTFEITAKGVDGGGWGVGPYDVYADESGNPSPLLMPFGEGDLEQIDTTTLPPPAAYCGANCDITPLAPRITVVTYINDPTGATAQLTWDNTPNGPVTINWGDGSMVQTGTTDQGTTTHVYTQTEDPQTFTITVADSNYTTAAATADFTVPAAA